MTHEETYHNLQQVYSFWSKAESYHWEDDAQPMGEGDTPKAYDHIFGQRSRDGYRDASRVSRRHAITWQQDCLIEAAHDAGVDDEMARRFRRFEGMGRYPWANRPPFLVPDSDEDIPVTNLIEDKPELFLRFADLGDSRETYRDLANEFGNLFQFNPVTGGVSGTPLNSWSRERFEMRSLADLWGWVTSKDMAMLRRCVLNWGNNIVVFSADENELIKYKSAEQFWENSAAPRVETMLGEYTYAPHLSYQSPYEEGELLAPARDGLEKMLNRKIETSNLIYRIVRNGDGNTEPVLIPQDLLSMLWVQFLLAFLGEKKYRRCEVCGLWQDVTDKRSDWRMHKSCGDRRRAKLYRERKKK